MSFFPHVTVATIVEQQGRFLIVEEQAGGERPVFNQPAGHLEKNESLIEAAVRETLEETAYRVSIHNFVGTQLWAMPDKDKTYLRFTFVGSVIEHLPEQPLDEGILAAHWMTADALRSQPARLRSPLVMASLDAYLNGQIHGLECVRYLRQNA